MCCAVLCAPAYVCVCHVLSNLYSNELFHLQGHWQLATSDCAGGFRSVHAQSVQAGVVSLAMVVEHFQCDH
jgi:hypothetical protein